MTLTLDEARPVVEPVGVSRWVLFAAAAVVVTTANVVVLAGFYVPFVTPLLGFAAVIGVPWVILGGTDVAPWLTGVERLLVSLGLTLVAVIGAALVVNGLLPLFGDTHPLSTTSVVVTIDVLCALLTAALWHRHPRRRMIGVSLGGRDLAVGATAALTIALAAMGAVRLDNGQGGGLSYANIVVVAMVLAALIAWRDRLRPGVIPFALYAISLSLLFMTSLRGWYTTGHDVQHEMAVFLHTATTRRWSISVPDPYNACVSITVLPTVILRWTRVDAPYVYKVFFQVLYAFCPLAVYRVAMRISSPFGALVSTIWFVGFIGFLQDMPMLNRQEIGFIFFACLLLCLLIPTPRRRERWGLVLLLAAGMVTSHYSTTYFATGLFALAWAFREVLGLLTPVLHRRGWFAVLAKENRGPRLGLLGAAVGIAAMSFVWTGPITHTGQGVLNDVSSVVNAVRGGTGSKAADTGYALLPHSRSVTAAEALQRYATVAASLRNLHPNGYYPVGLPSPALTPPAQGTQLPLTGAGRALNRLGIDVGTLNRLIRGASAALLQLLVIAGVLVVLIARRTHHRLSLDIVSLAGGTLAIGVLQVVLPVISTDYSLGRSFMQSLMVLAPFLVVGTSAMVPRRATPTAEEDHRLGRSFRDALRTIAPSLDLDEDAPDRLSWARTWLAGSVAVLFFASSAGLVTQALGHYGPQLDLNNSGDYYDAYYLTPQEVMAVGWLRTHAVGGAPGSPADIQMDTLLHNKTLSLGGVNVSGDIYPSLVHRDAYVFLGTTNVDQDRSFISINGFNLLYRYPLEFLDRNKALIYTDGDVRIYR